MIELRDLTRRFGDVTAVRDVSFDVDEGELVVLLGASGSGKTTTLKMINRLIEPTSGSVRIGGEDVRQGPPHELRRRIGYVFQGIGLFPHMTVAENIGVTPALLGWDRERIRQRVDELLEMVELGADMGGRWPSELSGGQQQRVGVARALAAEVEVMLFDEPFGALDPVTRDSLGSSLDRIRRGVGFTGIFVTHDMTEALVLGDRIAVMRDGELVQVGSPRELLAHPADEYVERLVSTPRRHAGLVDELLREEDGS